MANCGICGQAATSGKVHHADCWEKAVLELAEKFCEEYCRFPRECDDEEVLHEKHCDKCALIQVLNLGL